MTKGTILLNFAVRVGLFHWAVLTHRLLLFNVFQIGVHCPAIHTEFSGNCGLGHSSIKHLLDFLPPFQLLLPSHSERGFCSLETILLRQRHVKLPPFGVLSYWIGWASPSQYRHASIQHSSLSTCRTSSLVRTPQLQHSHKSSLYL